MTPSLHSSLSKDGEGLHTEELKEVRTEAVYIVVLAHLMSKGLRISLGNLQESMLAMGFSRLPVESNVCPAGPRSTALYSFSALPCLLL